MITTDERAAFVKAIRDFGSRECGSAAKRSDLTNGGEHGHNNELYAKLGKLGWLGCCFPEEFGGSGGGVTEACILMEETARADLPIHGLITSLIVGNTVRRYGSDLQRSEVIGGVCRGDVASIAMSEPGAGSDVAALACRADPVDGGFLISGQKTWTSCAHYAERILLVARTERSDRKHHGISMLLIPAETAGMVIRQIDTLGGREVNDIFFDEAFVPSEALLGVAGRGWSQLMDGLNFERLTLAAAVLGEAQRAFDDALSYIKEREQFGRPVGSFQTLKHRVADLATELECCRTLIYDVARRVDEQPDVQLAREASMTKLKATETAKRVVIDCMQMMGGYGYSSEFAMERHLRQVIISTVVGGSNEIQREIIGSSFGL